MRFAKKAWHKLRLASAWLSRRAYAAWSFLVSALVSMKETTTGWWWSLWYWRTRERIKHAAAEQLEEKMTGSVDEDAPSPGAEAESRAVLETAKAAEASAENAPMGSLSPEKALEQLEMAFEGVAVENPFQTETAEPVGRGMQTDHLSDIIRPFEDEDGNSKFESAVEQISITDENKAAAERRTDSIVTAPMTDVAEEPRGTQTRKTDLKATGYWETNPNAVEEVQEAARFPLVESQIRQTVIHLLTSSPKIAGPEKYSDVVRRWFEVEMEYSSGFELGIHRFVSDIAGQMLRYGTAPVVKQRTASAERSTYSDPVTGGTRLPVWGYRVPDSSTIQVFVDTQGRPRKLRQDPTLFHSASEITTYKMRDVHFAHLPFRNSEMYFWTPSLVTPVLYAVNVLEELHETIERHTKNIVDIPSYAKVGSRHLLDGKVTSSMLDDAAATIRETQPNQLIVFPWHIDLEKHESDEYVEQLVETGEYWERVVRRGIGQTKLTDGESLGASRNAADTFAEKGMRFAQALVPEIQRAARWLFIDRVLEEPGVSLSDFESYDDMPTLEFESINQQQQQARENQIAFLFQNDLIAHNEARMLLGRDPDDSREGEYFSDIQAELKDDGQSESRTRPGGSPRPKRKNS